jgi:2'-5' RNA ligase/endonuclease/exonuclease/phosphatase family metal-dependent hydrolase
VTLRPCDVVLAQLRWDARFDAATVMVVHEGRDGALLEARLSAFLEKGIPTHRVRALKIGVLTIWDRAARVDLLSSDPGRVVAAAGPPSTGVAEAALTVATWNVLGEGAREDRHAAPQEERAAAIVDVILSLEVDVVALEEVEPSLVSALALRREVVERYALVGAGAVELAGGLLLLAPPGTIEIATPRVSGRRRALVARLPSGTTVIVVHLSSDHRGDRSAVRREQLATLFPIVDGAPGMVIVAGDFNEEGAAVVEGLTARGLVDAWPVVHRDGDGTTYDPTTNPIAAQISRTGRRQRIDRVLVRGAVPSRAQVTTPIVDGAPLSDHAALVVALAPALATPLRASHDSACAIVPPRASWPAIDAIRARLDPAYGRWPPHINLVYPCVAPAALDDAERALARALVDEQPFGVRLDGFGTFARRQTVVWLRPVSDEGALARLQRAVESAVPLAGERAVTHHLTVAKCAPTEAAALERAGAPAIAPFSVDDVTLFVRQRGRMRPFARVPFGRGLDLDGAVAETGLVPDERRVRSVAAARALVEAAAREAGGGALVPIGSEALGVALADSDVDLVWEGRSLEALAEALVRRGVRARVVDGAFSRVVRARAEDISLDIILADEGGRTAIADAEALRARATAGFVAALRAVRIWAARRVVVGAAACMPSSLAWAVLVADACAALPDDSDVAAPLWSARSADGAPVRSPLRRRPRAMRPARSRRRRPMRSPPSSPAPPRSPLHRGFHGARSSRPSRRAAVSRRWRRSSSTVTTPMLRAAVSPAGCAPSSTRSPSAASAPVPIRARSPSTVAPRSRLASPRTTALPSTKPAPAPPSTAPAPPSHFR